VDLATEARIEVALDRLLTGRTSIVIAHRLSTVRRADRILVMGEGRVIEEGTHDELLSRPSAYRRLYESQFAA
jgi:ABC-type multidrug transport system fused ATPase/permease subunit